MLYRILCLMIALVALASSACADDAQPTTPPPPRNISAGNWNGNRAMNDIANQLTFGRRGLDTIGHEKTVVYIESQLAKTKASSVNGQQWIDTGETGNGSSWLGWDAKKTHGPNHAMVNIVARFFPDNPRRIIIGTHYDSIVRAYADKNHPEAPMPGANNSASGVALLLETARALSAMKEPPPVGVDIIFFDGEEGPLSLGAGDRNWRALGSPFFAQHLSDIYPDEKPESAVLFDMVCYKNLKLRPEPSSVEAAKDKVEKFWNIGASISPSIFKAEPYPYKIEDDHDALMSVGIPSFLVIGFEYDPWFNTTQDTIDKCSKTNIEAVGRTLLKYIYAQ